MDYKTTKFTNRLQKTTKHRTDYKVYQQTTKDYKTSDRLQSLLITTKDYKTSDTLQNIGQTTKFINRLQKTTKHRTDYKVY